MGLRRGELVGLRWADVDLDHRVLHICQQTQRRRGVLYDDDPKGRRRRAVPLPAMCIAALRWHRMRQNDQRAKAGDKWSEGGYVFTTASGRPVEPRNLYRSFTRVAASASLRVIRLHDARHGTATLLTAVGVGAPRRDGDPRAQPDQHHHGRLHARRPGHPAGGHQPWTGCSRGGLAVSDC